MSEELDLHAVFEASPNPYLVLLPDAPRFTIAAVNDAYLSATMTRREQLVGRGLFEAFPDNPDDPDATGVTNLRAALERVLAERRPNEMPIQRYDVRSPGTEAFLTRVWLPRNVPVLDPSGELTHVIHHAVDVTEIVGLRERLGASQDAVFAEAQRTAEVRQELHDTSDRLSDLLTSRRSVVEALIDEVRDPLRELLAELDSPDAAADGAALGAAIRPTLLSLVGFVDDLLDAARIGGGLQPLRYARFDLAQLLNREVERRRGEAVRRAQSLALDAPQELIVEADPDQVGRAIRHLLHTAITQSGEGDRIEVALTAGGAEALLTVSEPDVPAAVPRLGLRVTRGLARLHGGDLELLEVGGSPSGRTLALSLPLQAPAGTPVGLG